MRFKTDEKRPQEVSQLLCENGHDQDMLWVLELVEKLIPTFATKSVSQ